MLLLLQYDFNKYARLHLFKSRLVYKIKRKTTNKTYENLVLWYKIIIIQKNGSFNSNSDHSTIQSMLIFLNCICIAEKKDENYAIGYYASLYLIQNRA